MSEKAFASLRWWIHLGISWGSSKTPTSLPPLHKRNAHRPSARPAVRLCDGDPVQQVAIDRDGAALFRPQHWGHPGRQRFWLGGVRERRRERPTPRRLHILAGGRLGARTKFRAGSR